MRETSKVSPYFGQIPRWVGIFIIMAGLLVMASWQAHWQKILQLIPYTAPMQFNTAFSFLMCGGALFLMATARTKYAPFLAAAAPLLSFLTLLEYVFRCDFHIDLLFFTPYFEAATAFPGRMSPLAAVCFILVGIALLLLGTQGQWRHRAEAAGMLMCIVGMISLVALAGFALGIVSAYGWGAYSSLALNTSVLFLILSAGILIFSWQKAQQDNSDFARWLPITGSVTLMIMVAIVAAGDVRKLQTAAVRRKQAIQTIFAAQAFENDLIDLQRAMRSYITLGDTNSLASFQQMAESEGTELRELRKLTTDDSAQKQTLKELDAAVKNLLRYDHGLIKLYDDKGPKAAFNVETDREARLYFGRTHDVLKAFGVAEQELLDRREVSEAADFNDTERLLIFGCALAVGMILLANFLAGSQLSRRKIAEAKLARQAEALRRSNVELEQFAYVASHDMREPLRSVTGFAQILKRQSGGKLGEDSIQLIGRIVDGARRMSNIIDDLLALSSISSQKKPFEKMELEKPLRVAQENLSVAIAERAVAVRPEALPTLLMDGSQIALLFQNLIGNAIKFCPCDRAPEIKISAQPEASGVWTISVRDNGIGIDPKHFSRIFGIFQRLHSREEYPGTGIGLSICKKIVERHGGRIWLESQPGAGTTFHFTLTNRQPENYDGE